MMSNDYWVKRKPVSTETGVKGYYARKDLVCKDVYSVPLADGVHVFIPVEGEYNEETSNCE